MKGHCLFYLFTIRHLILEAIRSIDPDIVLLNHTGLHPKPIKLYGYNTRYTTGTPHDGVAIMVKNTLKHTHITDWPSAHFLATKIHTQHGPFLVATIYCRPNTGLPLTSLNTLFNHTNMPVYILASLDQTFQPVSHTMGQEDLTSSSLTDKPYPCTTIFPTAHSAAQTTFPSS